jgi:hypothetical protein
MSSPAPNPGRPARWLVAAVLLVLAVLGIDTAAWWLATGRLRQAYLAWQAALPAQGWQLAASPPVASGWPLAARLRIDGVRLGQAPPGGFGWTSARVRFGIALARPGVLAVDAGGAQSLAVPGLAPLQFRAGRLHAELPLSLPVRSVQATASDLAVALPAGVMEVAQADLQAEWAPRAVHVRVQAGPATLPPGHRWGLGQTIADGSLDLVVHGAWPGGTPRAAAGAWRDGGGSVELRQVAVRWGALDASGSGRAGLDGDLQPTARLDARVVAPQSALAALADAGAISRDAAVAAGAVLALLEVPGRLANQPDVLSLPLRLQGGGVLLGQIPVARLPKLAW